MRYLRYFLPIMIVAMVAACQVSTSTKPVLVQPRIANEVSRSAAVPAQTAEPSEPSSTPEPAEPSTPPTAEVTFNGLYMARVWLIVSDTDLETGLATVQMWFFLANNSNEPSPQVRLPIFSNAIDVFVDDAGYVVATEDNKPIVIRREPLPANSNDQLLIVDYKLPLDGLTGLAYQIPFPTADFAVYLPQTVRPQLEAPELNYQGIRLLRGLGDFLLFSAAEPVLADTSLTFDIVTAESLRYPDDTEFVDFTLSVMNGTANAVIPENLPVLLRSMRNSDDGVTLIEQREISWEAAPVGISQMPTYADGYIEALVLYNNITFWGRLDSLEATTNSETLTVMVFEPTNDPTVVELESVWYVVDAVTGEGWADFLVWYYFVNNSDRVYVGNGDSTNLLSLPLPPEIQSLQFQADFGPGVGVDSIDGAPYIIDNRLVLPQQRQALAFRFLIPYDGDLNFSHTIGYAASTIVVYTSAFRQLAFEGERFTATGEEELPDLGLHQGHTLVGLPADQPVIFAIADTSDTPQVELAESISDTDTATDFLTENRWVVFGIGVLMVVLGMMYFAFDLQRSRSRAKIAPTAIDTSSKHHAARQQELIEHIAALDDAYERGEIKEKSYQAQRQRLREELRQMMVDDSE